MALSLCGKAGVANTGELQCDKSKGILKKVFIFNGAINAGGYADETTLFNTLVANAKLSKDAANKIFVINEAQEIADSSESNTTGSLGLGFTVTLREGKPVYTVKIFAGADLLKRLRTFNNQTIRIFEYDANGVLWGTKKGANLVGYQAKLFFTGNRIATGQNVEEGVVTFTISILSNSEYMDNPVFADLSGNNIEDVIPLIDANLSYLSKASNVYKVKAEVPTSNLLGNYDVFDEYGTALAALSANFSAGTGANFATPLTITSIAVDNGLKALTVTFDNTAFGALSSDTQIRLNPPTPAQLDAGDVTGLELMSVILTK
ncbi:MAG: hypothetical protein KF862_07215 [Chitinophagaceae bacterium]|nr:hypothetical protein [Chitinophagaceae bacterium]